MDFCIAGLGGVGEYFGGRLASAYGKSQQHRVSFLCRGEHMTQIKKEGLIVKTLSDTFRAIPHMVSSSPVDIGPVDVIFFAVKGYDLFNMAETVHSLCHDRTLLIPVGNGIDNPHLLEKASLKGVFFNGCVYISAYISAPGEVRQVGGSCKMVAGPLDGRVERYGELESVMKEAGISFELTPHVEEAVWTKFIFMSPMAAITTLVEKTFGEVLSDPYLKQTLRELMEELHKLAQKKNISLPEDIVDRSLAQARSFPSGTRSSMELDYSRGRRVELETFVGAVVHLASSLQVPVPVYDQIYRRLHNKILTSGKERR